MSNFKLVPPLILSFLNTRTPGIVKGNNPLSLVWFKWGSQWWGILKHFPQSRCILISHWSREKKQSSFIIYIEGTNWLGFKWLILFTFSWQFLVSLRISWFVPWQQRCIGGKYYLFQTKIVLYKQFKIIPICFKQTFQTRGVHIPNSRSARSEFNWK